MNNLMFLITMILLLGLLAMILLGSYFTFGDKRECGNLTWNSEGHDDHNAKNKLNSDSDKKDICEVSKDVDHMRLKGTIKDWTMFLTSEVYKSSTDEQKDCLKKGFDSQDHGHKALQAYEISYCGWDTD